ncbi:membrane protein [Rhodococcoides trifolii]|uniref:Membrane protein n=1 Tax=Rhodococcoides trifolii TaxID=908250 RepID=A0A917FSX1_9NOCA|nr:nicotinamide riboside transporter PnuC [Rhodococcus trifolii]GGF98820.1 membrane protein [Rhodococcus trifolii]
MIEWLGSTAFTSFGAPTSWVEIIGFATGALCVYLVARQSVWNWPIGIANNVAFVLLFFSAGLFADTALQFVYIALALWGWVTWIRGGDRGPLVVTSTTRREWLWLVLIGMISTAVMTWFLDNATSSIVPFWDAVTTTLSLLATWGQIKKRRESWFLWIAADVIYVPLYLYKDLILTGVLYLGFIALCVGGLRAWTRSMNTEREAVTV